MCVCVYVCAVTFTAQRNSFADECECGRMVVVVVDVVVFVVNAA